MLLALKALHRYKNKSVLLGSWEIVFYSALKVTIVATIALALHRGPLYIMHSRSFVHVFL